MREVTPCQIWTTEMELKRSIFADKNHASSIRLRIDTHWTQSFEGGSKVWLRPDNVEHVDAVKILHRHEPF